MAHFDTLSVIGIGLLGGSLGLAAKERGLVRRVIGVARTPATLDLARQKGCADETTHDLRAAVAEADLVVLATPVGFVPEALRQLKDCLQPGAVVTDVASTKATICAAAEAQLADGGTFVGGHPMAGDHLAGVAHARASLFDDCVWVLTPSAASTPEALHRLAEFARALDARPLELEPATHDQLVAAVSHLPHVAAAAVVNAAWRAAEGDRRATQLAATGFRDTTRVAAGDADLWDDIVLDNAEALLAALDRLRDEIDALHAAVAARDEGAIRAFLQAACERRATLMGESPV